MLPAPVTSPANCGRFVLFRQGKKSTRNPAMTLSWTEWLREKGERNSRSYDFSKARPAGKMRGFWICAGVVGVCLVFVSMWAYTRH